MPPLPTAQGAIKWEVHQVLGDDSNLVNVMHLVSDDLSTSSFTQLSVVAASAKAAWDANPLTHQSHQLTCDHHVFTELSTPTGPQVIIADGGIGGSGTDSMPASAALVMQAKALTRGKSFRGRIFVGGLPKSGQNDPQHWTVSETNAFTADFTAMQTTLFALARPYDFAIVSYFGPPTVKAGSTSPGVPKRAHSTIRAAGLVTKVSAFTGDTRIGAQRRRNL
jgi:hypothetical protein